MTFRLSFLIVAFTLTGTVSAAQEATPTNSSVASLTSASDSHALRLSAGDLFEIKVLGTNDPDFAAKLRVDGQGMVNLPYAGPVKVAGRTAEDAGALIEATFRDKDVLKNPHVSVTVLEYATQGVTVGGEVKNPGVYPLLGTHNLLDLLAAAGGVTPTAGKGVTITHRDDPAHPQIVNVETKPGSTVAYNADVRPGDTIVVSRAGIVYVLGDVGKPGGFLIENSDRLTVLQAIALAQGTNRTAALNNAKLIRKTPTGREETQIALKKILADKGDDKPLNDGDILFVPTSGAKSALSSVASILPSTAAAAIYHVP